MGYAGAEVGAVRNGLLCATDPDLPEVDGGMCCMGAAALGRCTCWDEEHDLDQAPVRDWSAKPVARESPCSDCAFHANSPERQGAERYANASPEQLQDIASGAQPFLCHQGMRRVLRYRHPAGVVVEASPANYDPPMRGPMAFKADGTPADICAGWVREHAKEEAAFERYKAEHPEEFKGDRT